MKLQIDFVSQQGNQYRNDCGAACVAMCASNALAGVTTDEVLAAIEQPKSKPLLFEDLYDALRAYRLPFEYIRAHLPDLRHWLANGNPVIALVGYGQLPPEHKAQRSFDGAHFVLVVGFTPDAFLVHDPLWPFLANKPAGGQVEPKTNWTFIGGVDDAGAVGAVACPALGLGQAAVALLAQAFGELAGTAVALQISTQSKRSWHLLQSTPATPAPSP